MFVTSKPVSQHRPQTLGSINRFSAVTSILLSHSLRIRIHFFLLFAQVRIYVYMFTVGKTRENTERWREKKNSLDRPSHPNLAGRLSRPTIIILYIILLLYRYIFFLCAHLCYMAVLSWKVPVVSAYREGRRGGLVERKRKKNHQGFIAVKSRGWLAGCCYYYNIIVIDTVTDETFVVGVIVTRSQLSVHEAYSRRNPTHSL